MLRWMCMRFLQQVWKINCAGKQTQQADRPAHTSMLAVLPLKEWRPAWLMFVGQGQHGNALFVGCKQLRCCIGMRKRQWVGRGNWTALGFQVVLLPSAAPTFWARVTYNKVVCDESKLPGSSCRIVRSFWTIPRLAGWVLGVNGIQQWPWLDWGCVCSILVGWVYWRNRGGTACDHLHVAPFVLWRGKAVRQGREARQRLTSVSICQ